MAGVKQKSVAQKKLEGTYRKDRDGKADKVETAFREVALTPSTEPIIPTEIKDDSLKQLYVDHFRKLVKLGLLMPADLIEFEQLFIYAQSLRDLNNEIKKQDIKTENGLERFQHLTYVSLKISARISELGKRYMLSPATRSKLTIDQLEIERKSSENQSVIGKLISKKKEV